MASEEFEQVVTECYEALYRFAFSLAGTEADASDLTQQTFYVWAAKGHQLRDRRKAKAWLFTILQRQFLSIRNRAARFPHFELNETDEELPVISPERFSPLDTARALECLGRLREPSRLALSLFYLEDHSYVEIAQILGISIGTVRSRISRGVAQLKQSIFAAAGTKSLGTRSERCVAKPRPQ
jgi:RNA polymerase sigma factor (sigma-70 family)